MRPPGPPVTTATITRRPTGVCIDDGTVSFGSAAVQPANREPLSAERFLTEAAQLHQTWIRRFDAQHRRRPRPPEIEAERLRLVRRLQLVQRLQQEATSAEELLTKLRELTIAPREARL